MINSSVNSVYITALKEITCSKNVDQLYIKQVALNSTTVGALPCVRSITTTGWCKSHGTVLLLSSAKTGMTETIKIGLKIFPQQFCNQKNIFL